jgi:hypothetical protein
MYCGHGWLRWRTKQDPSLGVGAWWGSLAHALVGDGARGAALGIRIRVRDCHSESRPTTAVIEVQPRVAAVVLTGRRPDALLIRRQSLPATRIPPCERYERPNAALLVGLSMVGLSDSTARRRDFSIDKTGSWDVPLRLRATAHSRRHSRADPTHGFAETRVLWPRSRVRVRLALTRRPRCGGVEQWPTCRRERMIQGP